MTHLTTDESKDVSQSILERNIAALRGLNPGLASSLQSLPDASARTVEFSPSKQGVLCGSYEGQQLASRYRPLDEAERFALEFDPIEKPVVTILGFGFGYHVRACAERLKQTGIVIVFEPDIDLLRSVLSHVDHSDWIREHDIYIFTEAQDRAEVNARLDRIIALVTQGTILLDHVPSRSRLGELSSAFAATFASAVGAMRTSLTTTLVHSVTTCRNLCLNIGHYGLGEGIKDLQDWARGHTAILIAAGPSLSRNIELLKNPKIRERNVIIAVQTALKPLLNMGIRPHFVTAIDYHEISSQFYEGLTAESVEGITLLCEPKTNHAVLHGYPGKIRCVGNNFLANVLAEAAPDNPVVKPGATVAHLNFFLAQFLGCDPICFVGQDLGFSDGVYYGPAAAIHDQWAPELNRFNTLDMMEWQRVIRGKITLQDAIDHRGDKIYVDEQMATYLKVFESEFRSAPQRLIDATEGGVVKESTEILSLQEVLDHSLLEPPLPAMPSQFGNAEQAATNRKRLRTRLRTLRQGVFNLGDISRRSVAILDEMIEHQEDEARMDQLFTDIDSLRIQVDEMSEEMQLVGQLNQLGIYNRLRADRALQLSEDLDETIRQKRQLERDRVNVQWIGDASHEFVKILDESDQILQGNAVDPRIGARAMTDVVSIASSSDLPENTAPISVAAIIAADPKRNGLLIPRSLSETFQGRSVLQCTLEQLNPCTTFDDIILVVPCEFEVESIIDRSMLNKNIIIHRSDAPLYDAHHATVAVARRWSDSSWRGGIGGMSVFDEIICPRIMTEALDAHDINTALVIGPDWPLVDNSNETGCDALVNRYIEQPGSFEIVFSQAPPGLGGCVISRARLAEMAERDRRQSIGASLTYMPILPQRDPIAMDMCVKLPANIRSRGSRVTFDSHHRRELLRETIGNDDVALSTSEILDRLEDSPRRSRIPHFIELELTPNRLATGPIVPQSVIALDRPDLTEPMLDRVATQFAARDDGAMTLRGMGDPLLHAQFVPMVQQLRKAGVMAIHVHTDLLEPSEATDELLQLPIDVISVNLNADTKTTYEKAMGIDRFADVIGNMERLINKRTAMVGSLELLALPWIVPTLIRCQETLSDMREFYDRWMYFLNAAIIEPFPVCGHADVIWRDSLLHLTNPPHIQKRDDQQSMIIWSDGSVPVHASDWRGETSVGNILDHSLEELWARVQDRREMKQLEVQVKATPARSTPKDCEDALAASIRNVIATSAAG